jgi:pyruvate decarboxylase
VASKIQLPAFVNQVPKEDGHVISHSWLWPRLGYFFQPKDVIVTETGTANFGILDVPLPGGATLVSQILWGSIGWSVGSCLGAALAARDVGMQRVILFVGDGSLQLTVQELSPMIRKGLKPIIFVLNNKGYSIERYIHGKHRKYNDIANWKWTSLLDVLNDDTKYETASYAVTTKKELSDLLDDSSFASANKMQLVEVLMDAFDAPEPLIRQAELTGKGNVYGGKN